MRTLWAWTCFVSSNPLLSDTDANIDRFIASGFDPGTVFCIFHATGLPTDGWGNRKAYCHPLGPEVFLGRRTVLCCELSLPEDRNVTRTAKGLFKKAKQMVDEIVKI